MSINDRKVLFFGSAISIWEPSTIANGLEVSNVLLSYLFGKTYTESFERTDSINWYQDLPFELINDCCPVDLSTFFSSILNTSKPNFFHKEIANSANSGQFEALLTTNYDQGIELSLSKDNNINVFYEPEEYSRSTISYYKLHGSAEEPSSMVYKLAQESRFPKKKKELLKKILEGRQLIIIGYSGIDFEICPSIIYSNPKEIIWYVKPGDEGETAGYKLVSEHYKINRKEWDLQNGLPWKATTKKLNISETIGVRILNNLKQQINDDVRFEWALNLCSRIGYPDFSRTILDKCQIRKNIEYLKYDASTDFHAGLYKNAAKKYKVAYKNKLKIKKYDEALNYLTGRIESLLCYGSFVRVFIAFLTAFFIVYRHSDDKNSLLISSKIVRIAVEFKRIMPALNVKVLTNLQANLARRSMKYFEKNGRFIEMYALKEHLLELTENNTYDLGFKHLGIPVSYSRSTRLDMKDISEINLLEDYFSIIRKMGCHAEAWKLSLMIERLHSNKLDKLMWKRRRKECFNCLQQSIFCTIIHYFLAWNKCRAIKQRS